MAVSGSSPNLKMNMAALKRVDPYSIEILATATQVALYIFKSAENEWERTSVEGSLFVYARCGEPYRSFVIMNRLSIHNLVQPVTKEMEFQIQTPFLLYRNNDNVIFGIWFYKHEECAAIGRMIDSFAHGGTGAHSKNKGQIATQNGSGPAAPMLHVPSHQSHAVDIVTLLTKAQGDLQKRKSAELPGESSQEFADIGHLGGNGDTGGNTLIKPMPLRVMQQNPKGSQNNVEEKRMLSSTPPKSVIDFFEKAKNQQQQKQRKSPQETGFSSSSVPKKEVMKIKQQSNQQGLLNFVTAPTAPHLPHSLTESRHDGALKKDVLGGFLESIGQHPKVTDNFNTGSNVAGLGKAADSVRTPEIHPSTLPLLQRLMSNPEHSVEHIEKLQQEKSSEISTRHSGVVHSTPTSGTTHVPMHVKTAESLERVLRQNLQLSESEKISEAGCGGRDKEEVEESTLAKLGLIRTPSQPVKSSPINSPTGPIPLMTPRMFTTTSKVDAISTSTPSKPEESGVSKLKVGSKSEKSEAVQVNSLPDESNDEVSPLTRSQLVQAFQYMLKNDADFVNQLHEAYVRSFHAPRSS